MLRRIAFFLLVFSLFASAQAKHPFTFEDMMQLKRVGEPTVSPDSKWVAFSAVDVNLDANTKTPHLWIVPVAGGEAKRLTPATGPGEDRVRFSPDGKRVIFESDRGGGTQIWVQDFDSASGALTGDPQESHHDLDRGLRRHVVAGWQERAVRFLRLSRLQGRRLQQAARRRAAPSRR